MSPVVQLLVLFLCGAVTAALTVIAYHADRGHRRLWLLAPLVIALQVFLFVLGSGPPVMVWLLGETPLSIAVFPVNLVLILLGYAKKGVHELRLVLFRYILGANLIICLVSLLSGAFFGCKVWLGVAAAGLNFFAVVLVVIDALVMVIAYDAIPKKVHRFARIMLPLLLALMIDALGYSVCLRYWFPERFPSSDGLIAAQLIGKVGAALFWGALLDWYARAWEPELLTEPPAPPNGLAFASRLLRLKSDEALLRGVPLGLEEGGSLAAVADRFDTLLGEVVIRTWGGVGAMVVRPPGEAGEPSLTAWRERTLKRLVEATRGRINGLTAVAGRAIVVVLYDADGARLGSVLQQLERDFSLTPSSSFVLLSEGEQPHKRPSGQGKLQQLLGDVATVAAPRPGESPEKLTGDALVALARDWPSLLASHRGEWVAYYGSKRLGFDRRSYRLYDRFIASDRPAQTLLVVQIDPDLAETFPQLGTLTNGAEMQAT